MSRVARLIHDWHSMRATPSWLTISLLQMSRNCKGWIIVNYKRFFEWNIIDLDRLFYEDFRQFSNLLWSKCRILFNCSTFLYSSSPNITNQDLALIVVLDDSSRTNLETKSVPDVYVHLLQHLEVLYRIVVALSRYHLIYNSKTYHFQRVYEKHAWSPWVSHSHNYWKEHDGLLWDRWS